MFYTFCLCLFGTGCCYVASSVASARNDTLIEATLRQHNKTSVEYGAKIGKTEKPFSLQGCEVQF